MKASIAENLTRPAQDPVMRQAVSTANVIWNTAKRSCGIEPCSVLTPIPCIPKKESPPIKELPSENASE